MPACSPLKITHLMYPGITLILFQCSVTKTGCHSPLGGSEALYCTFSNILPSNGPQNPEHETLYSCISINSDVNTLLPLPVNSVSAITSQRFMPSLLQKTSTLVSGQILRSSGGKRPVVPFWTHRHLFPWSLMSSLQKSRSPKPPVQWDRAGQRVVLCPHLLTKPLSTTMSPHQQNYSVFLTGGD